LKLQEKYNFNYLTNCDGESLIHLYNKGGIDFMCENLYGVFAFILFDTVKKTVYVGRDTFGVRPAFKLTTKNGTLALCSEAKGLLSVITEEKEKEIVAIEPGTYEEFGLVLKSDNVYKTKFIRKKKFHVIGNMPKYEVNVKLVSDDVYANLRACLTNAVKMRLMSHRRIGCLLSGGLDSSLISGLMVHEARKIGINYPIQTFSIGMGDESPDVVAARKVLM
jgi:asparagine synthase (glutamine-hydrolysing)